MTSQDKLLLGADLVKDVSVLERAYDDSLGITAKFNLNLLQRINSELAADFDLQFWKHNLKNRRCYHIFELILQKYQGATYVHVYMGGQEDHPEANKHSSE